VARIDTPRDERDDIEPLTLTQIVECPECELEFELRFTAPPGVEDIEDIEEPDALKVEAHPCPGCGFEADHQYSGWTVHGDAG
jgi:hypothetical protein